MGAVRNACVSAVIPTCNRPAMVVAAVESALAQLEGLLEVIVVVDGPDLPTIMALEHVQAREATGTVRVLALGTSVGGAEARNCGVRAANGAWIAFLDDDDLWLPNKLALQLALAKQSRAAEPVIASAVLARGPGFEAVWPRSLYEPGTSMAEYLFCRKSWTYGAALLQTSTLLAPRALLLRVPFTRGLKKHQDWDWLLRVSSEPEVEVLQSPVPLAIFHVEGNRASVGRAPDWQFSMRWAAEQRSLFTPRAFSAFIATECAPQAASAGATLGERAALLRAVVLQGSPTARVLLLCCAFLLVPQSWRRALRNTLRLVLGSCPATLPPPARAAAGPRN